jgi:hypothetical protein
MNLTRTLNSYLDGLANLRLGFRAPSVFVPFAAFGALQCALLVLLAFFAASPIASFMVPVVRALGGEDSLHYPLHFVRLPEVYQRIYLPLAAIVGFAAWSAGVWLMVDHHVVGRSRPRPSFLSALPAVIGVGVVFVGISVAVGYGLGRVAALLPPGLPTRAAVVASVALTACAQTFLVYTPVVLRLRGGGALPAVRSSVRYAARNFAPTLLVVVTVLAIHAPVDFLLARSDGIASRFQPELVFHLLLASALLEMFTAYFLFAATTALALPEEGGIR